MSKSTTVKIVSSAVLQSFSTEWKKEINDCVQ